MSILKGYYTLKVRCDLCGKEKALEAPSRFGALTMFADRGWKICGVGGKRLGATCDACWRKARAADRAAYVESERAAEAPKGGADADRP